MEKNVRLRVLYVMELFVQQTDAENGVTMQEILDWLADHNLTGERKSIYEDIHALKEFGLDLNRTGYPSLIMRRQNGSKTVNSVYLFTGGCSVYRHSIMSGIPEICTSRVWRSGSITEILLESIRSLGTRISFRCLQHRSSSRRSG